MRRRALLFAGILASRLQLAAQGLEQRQFAEHWNHMVHAMNELGAELRGGVSNLRSFDRADKAIDALRADPGWLRKEKRK